jgi:Leucine-rich repeat (LRR) protein
MPKTYLRVLFLQYNGWISLPTEMFHSFSKINNIDRLNLVGNKFSMINGSIFKRLKGLYRLKIQGNRISEINLSGLSYLSYLNLAHNDLVEVPKLCDNESESLLPSLKMVRLDDNKIKYLTLFKCLPKLQSLTLSNNRTVTIHENCFKSLNNLKELNLYKAGNPINKIEDGAFSSDCMETMTFSI